MSRFLSIGILCLNLLLTATTAQSQQPSALLKARLEPDSIINQDKSQLIVEAQSPQLTKSHLEITAPPGFAVVPDTSVTLPPFQGHFTIASLSIRATSNHPEIRPYTILVRLVDDNSTNPSPLAETSLQVSYVERLSIVSYLLWGAVGILLGYTIRILVKTLQSVPPPPLAPVPGPGVGPITAFVQKNYYLVDCSVTLVIGLISMELLLKNNHVPDSGLYWYAALGSGVALGVLTNSDLIVKLR